MKEADEFSKQYEEFLLKEFPNIHKALTEYKITACLKDTEDKKVFIVEKQGKSYICKMMKGSYSENIKSEYDTLSILSEQSAAFPKPESILRDKNWCFLIEEYMEGTSLEELCNLGRKFTYQQIIQIGLSLCAILKVMHHQPIPLIHRDISPSNVILSCNGKVSLIDFEISRHFDENKTKDTSFMGTEVTAPPEQYGYAQTDVRSDIYSLGVLLYYLASGSFNIRKLNNSLLPKELKKVIKKCTAFAPKDRYSDIKYLEYRLMKLSLSPIFLDNPAPLLKRYRSLQKGFIAILLLCIFFLAYFVKGEYIKYDMMKPYQFSSSEIEKAVRKELNLGRKEIITKNTLLKVQNLFLCGESIYDRDTVYEYWGNGSMINEMDFVGGRGNITDLSDLKYMKNLTSLTLAEQKISDLSPLKGLAIRDLYLCSNFISDISPLESCDSLCTLFIGGNPIYNYEVLGKMKKLKALNLIQNNIPSLDFLVNMDLKELYLHPSTIQEKEFSYLETQKNLEVFNINDIEEKDLEYIVSMKKLKRLDIGSYPSSNLEPLSTLTQLESLVVSNSKKIKTLKGIENFTNLNDLGIDNTNIKDIHLLKDLKKLTFINVTNTPITDFSPVKNRGNLLCYDDAEQ